MHNMRRYLQSRVFVYMGLSNGSWGVIDSRSRGGMHAAGKAPQNVPVLPNRTPVTCRKKNSSSLCLRHGASESKNKTLHVEPDKDSSWLWEEIPAPHCHITLQC